jgi:hypothetical protein
MSEQTDTWTPGIEYILEEIRENSIIISDYHKDRYYYQKGYLKYFRIPTIILAALNSVFSVGLQPYCSQSIISVLCCFISMMCGIISSIELFLSIQANMEKELIASKDFYLLSVDIFKMLYLERETRMVNGKIYLDEIYQTYCKLIENSNLVKKNMQSLGAAINPGKNIKNINTKQILEEECIKDPSPNHVIISPPELKPDVEIELESDVGPAQPDLESGINIEISEIVDETDIHKPKRKYNKKGK